MRPIPAVTALVGVFALLMAYACGHSTNDAASSPADVQAALTYGYGPSSNATVIYQSDVTVVAGGPRSILGASADGLTWIIDGTAPGARDLAPGRIMFATSRAVGRIVRMEPRGSHLAVTLAPVRLTEIIRNGEITVDQMLTARDFISHYTPELPGVTSTPPATLTRLNDVARPGLAPAVWTRRESSGLHLRLVGLSDPGAGQAEALKDSLKAVVGDYELEPYFRDADGADAHVRDEIGLKVRRRGAGLKLGLDLRLYARRLRVRTNLSIRDGHLGPSSFALDGLEGLALDVLARAANGSRDNVRTRIEVPVEVLEPIPPNPLTGGFPLVVQIKFKFIIEAAFGAMNTSLDASGEYALSGALGMMNGTLATPKMTLTRSMLESIKGVSLGVTGMVWASEARFLVGAGIPAAMAGPYSKVTISTGILRGSDLAAPLVTCIGQTLKVDMAYGFAAQMSSTVHEALEKLLGTRVRAEAEVAEKNETSWDVRAARPDVPLCRSAIGAK